MARLEEFDDVQLDVEFTQAGTRSNITSNENIAISFGKIAKWYEALVPTGGSSGQFLGFNSSGTAKWVSNPNVDEKVKATKLAQSTAEASYYPTLVAGEGTAGVSIIDSAKINHSPGTTSIVGNTRLILGNGINEGTTNNEAGLLRIYSSGTKYHTLKGAKITTDNVDHTLPTIGGTILNTGTTSFTQTLSSGTKIGTIKINGTSSDIYATTVNDAALTLKGAGTTVTTFTANASSAKSLDIVAGSNVTVTADATNAKISIAASHPTITKSTDTTSTVSPAHGGTFTVVDSITREANGHVTKINTKTVTLPADSNTDTKVTQSQTTTTNYRPILFGAKDSTDISTLANTVTDQAYTSTKMFAKPDTGILYASGFSTSSFINGTGAQLLQHGLYLKSYKSASLPAGGNYSYEEYAIRVYDGKAADNNGMLLTIDGGGLTIVGGGESAKSLAALISDDQRDSNTSRTRLDVGGTLNTAYHGSEEQLILSSDNNIYFLTTCQTIANRKPVVLDVNSYFYPGTTKTGSIGTSSYMWNSVYAATIYENGTSLASKYAAIGHTHSYLPLAGGTMTGDITFATISGDTYPISSKGIKWGGGTDAIDMYYNLRASDAGELIINMRDDSNVRTSFAYNGTVKSYIDTNGTYNGNASKTGIRWNAVSQGQKWSRLYYSETAVNVEGSNGILSISCTRGNVVVNAVFLVFVSHSGPNASHIIELASTNYSTIRCRVVSNSAGSYYFEIYDTANNIASGTSQAWHCCFVTLTDATLTTYTTFTDGSTIPSNFAAANDFTTTVGKASAAIKDISRSGTTFTATRQDGTTFTFTQQDNNTTYTVATGDSNGQIKVTPSSGSAYNVSVKGLGSAAYTASTSYVPINGKAPNGIGRDGYVAYATDGFLNYGTGTVTGALVITTPFTKTKGEVMLKFTVDIFNYKNNTSVEYKISGYAYNDGKWYNCTAYCVSSGVYSADNIDNLTVRFGYVADGFYQVQIGETTTDKWQYPRINIHDISVAYNRTNYTDANSGWSLEFVTSGNIPNITQTITNTAQQITPISVTSSTLDTTPGTFVFFGSGAPWTGSDWCGLQVGFQDDRFQIVASNGTLAVRQNDSSGTPTTTGWTEWKTLSTTDHTHNYAGSSSAGGPATNVAIARVTKDSKVFPGANKVVFEEYSPGTNYNLPGNHWYHIMSAQGNDTNYGTQLALGMTATAAYYRVYNNRTWSDWKSLINTDTTYSANNGVGLSGTTFYNSGVRAVSTGSTNGTISVNTNGTSADVAVKGLGSAAYTESSAYATSSHTHGLLHSNLNQPASDVTTDAWATVGIDPTVNGYVLKSIRYMTNVPPWGPPSYGAGIAFGGQDTKALINIGYASPNITFVGGNHNSSKTAPTWYIKLTGTTTTTYNLDNFYVTTTSRTANTVLAAPNGSNGAATFRKLVAADIPTLNYIGAKSDGSYYGMTNPAGADNVWIRTTSLGIIPYQSGNAGSGHGSLGTSSWYFSSAYIDNIYGSLNGNATTATKATQDGDGNTISSTYLKLSGGTMTGDITFTGAGTSSYPSKSKGIYWSGGTDAIDMYYNLRTADAGELIINMRDDSNVRTSFAYNGTVKSYIDTNGTYNGNASTATKATQDGDGNTISSTYLKLSGGTMTGQLKTSFKESVAVGSYQAQATKIPDLCTELRYSSGAMGSVALTEAYTKDGITIAATWYNFIWIPHRSGGVNGAASGDNCNYGSLILSGMTGSGAFIIRYASGSIAELKYLYKDTTYSANNGVGLSGTTFYNSGVRSTTLNGNYLRVNTNGTNDDLTIPYATKSSSVSSSGTRSSWWNDRDNSVVQITTGDIGYRPLWSLLTATSGSWAMGNHTDDDLVFNFTSKAVYDTGNNPSTNVQIHFTNGGAITASGLTLTNSGYGPLKIVRSDPYYAGIKFYNNTSTYLGSIAINAANNRFVRFKTDESTSYTILDTSLLNVTETVNLGLDGGTNAFGYVSGLTKAAWNFQQTDGTIIRQFYNANWKSEIYMDYRTGQMSTRGKNNGTWQDWRIHLDSGNFSSYAVPIKTGGGIAECSGNGEYLYYTIATITISGAYVNKPILFEISGRGHHFTRLEVEFASSSSTDPGLDTNGFVADGYHGFWIKKTATSTWAVYGMYSEKWGNAVLHRITGCGTSEVTVTVNMTNYGNSLPDGCTQVTYGWMALLADRALRADKASKLSTSSAIGSDTQPVYFDSDGYPTACYPMSRTSTIYDNSSGTSTIISDLTIPADTKYFKIFIFDFNTSGSHYVTNVIDIGVDDGYYGGVISGSSQSQSFPCVITVVQLIVATTSNNRKQISIGRSSSWTIGASPSSSTHTLYIRKIIACT